MATGEPALDPRGALPNLVVIGAQKCGTSGLHYILGVHPEISMSSPKELNFFVAERNWPRGVEWYREHFDPEAAVRGESSPNYTTYPHHLGIPERMHEVVPGAKLIFLVRDPLERIAAHWVHNYAKRRERGDLRETLLHPNTTYVLRSKYHAQLRQFLNHYDALPGARHRPGGPAPAALRDAARGLRASSASIPTSSTRAFTASATARRASAARPRSASRSSRCAGRAGGSRVPKVFWNLLDIGVLGRPIPRPGRARRPRPRGDRGPARGRRSPA